MGIGKIFYKLFFKPTHHIRYNLSHFGLLGWIRYVKGENDMRKAAEKEPPVNISNHPQAIQVAYLTGNKYWHQTIYAIKSLANHVDGNCRIEIYSDGSLTPQQAAILQKFCPQIKYITESEVLAHLDKHFPVTQYPTLRFLRDWHPFFRRMIDIHISKEWVVHLDSDMIFFNRPSEIIEGHKKKRALYMRELLTSSFYVDDIVTLRDRHGIICTEKINGGVVAYNGAIINYTDLEEKAALLVKNYFNKGPAKIEQTLMAYLLHQQNAIGLNADKYHIFYEKEINRNSEQILRHYIFKAKLPYFSTEWKTLTR